MIGLNSIEVNAPFSRVSSHMSFDMVGRVESHPADFTDVRPEMMLKIMLTDVSDPVGLLSVFHLSPV